MADRAIYNFIDDSGNNVPLKASDNGDGTYSLSQVAEIAPSENFIGSTGSVATQVDLIPTLSVHATYVAGDYVGESGAAMVLPGVARVNGGTGMIVTTVLIDYAKQGIAGEIWLFDDVPTPPADSAAWALSDADSAKCIGIIPIDASDYHATANNTVASIHNKPVGFKCKSDRNRIYCCFVTRGAPAYASGDLVFRFNVIQS